MSKKYFPCLLILCFALSCSYNAIDLDCTTISGASFSFSGGQLQTILQNKCSGIDCHSPGGEGSVNWAIGPYNSLKPHFSAMYEAVKSGSMPEAGSAPLTAEERNQFECWQQGGFRE